MSYKHDLKEEDDEENRSNRDEYDNDNNNQTNIMDDQQEDNVVEEDETSQKQQPVDVTNEPDADQQQQQADTEPDPVEDSEHDYEPEQEPEEEMALDLSVKSSRPVIVQSINNNNNNNNKRKNKPIKSTLLKCVDELATNREREVDDEDDDNDNNEAEAEPEPDEEVEVEPDVEESVVDQEMDEPAGDEYQESFVNTSVNEDYLNDDEPLVDEQQFEHDASSSYTADFEPETNGAASSRATKSASSQPKKDHKSNRQSKPQKQQHQHQQQQQEQQHQQQLSIMASYLIPSQESSKNVRTTSIPTGKSSAPAASTAASKKQMRFQCRFCIYKSHSVSLMQNHIYRHIDTTPYSCFYCGHKSTTKSTIMVHIELCHPNMEVKIKESRVKEEDYYLDLNSSSSSSSSSTPASAEHTSRTFTNKKQSTPTTVQSVHHSQTGHTRGVKRKSDLIDASESTTNEDQHQHQHQQQASGNEATLLTSVLSYKPASVHSNSPSSSSSSSLSSSASSLCSSPSISPTPILQSQKNQPNHSSSSHNISAPESTPPTQASSVPFDQSNFLKQHEQDGFNQMNANQSLDGNIFIFILNF